MVEERDLPTDCCIKHTVYNCWLCSNPTRHINSDHTSDELKCTSSFEGKDDSTSHKRMKHTLQKCEECDFTTNEKCALEYHFLTMHPPDLWVEKSAMDGKLMEHTFKVEGGECPLNVFKDYEGKIKKILNKMLERGKTVKSYIRMNISMGEKNDIDVCNIKRKKKLRKTNVWFEGGIRALYSETCVDLLYDLTLMDILKDFEAYNEKKYGWVFERVVNLQLHTAKFNSMNAEKYIPTPKFIEHAVVNIKNEEDDCCFLWSIIAALSSKDRVSLNDPTNIEYYNILKHNHNLKFDGITFPIKMEDIPQWEDMNDIPIAVYGVKENGQEVYPLYYTKRRDKKPINLLLIEGEEKNHYAWIKNLDCLMTCEERQNDGEYYTCQCMMYRTREELIQPRWLLDDGAGECLVGEGGKEVQMDGELEDELEDLLDMESDAFAHS